MEAIKSKVDKETVYKIFDNKITITRGGDSLQIAYSNLDETIKIFKAEIQDEIRALRDSEKGRRCKHCDKFFISERKRKYCSNECSKAAEKKSKSDVATIEREARKKGLRYADIQIAETLAMIGSIKR